MKKHIIVNGNILKTDKKWSHLRQKQKELISIWLRTEYTYFVQIHCRKPKNYEHDKILLAVMEKIHKRQIWIPYEEVEKYYKRKMRKWYRKIEDECI